MPRLLILLFCFILWLPLVSGQTSFENFLKNGEWPELLNYEDTLKLMEFLLDQKGNTKVNCSWSGWTGGDTIKLRERSARMSSSSDAPFCISNQLAALYLISAIYSDSLRFTSFVEIHHYDSTEGKGKTIYNKRMGKCYLCIFKKQKPGSTYYRLRTSDRKHMKSLFKMYRNWYKEVQKKGLYEMRAAGNDPLAGSLYYWPEPF